MPRLLYVVTHPLTARHLLRGHLAHMASEGFEVHLAVAPGPGLDEVREREGVTVHEMPMEREISPLSDLASLARLVRLMRRLRPDLVNAGTPKAGLLGTLAARLAGVPAIIYTLRGLRLETASGAKRRVLWATERLAAACAHRVVCVSPSLRRRAVELGLVGSAKALVLASGSSNGVDAERFEPTGTRRQEAAELRRRLGIPDGAPVVGFVGRLVRDKGIGEMLAAFDRVRLQKPETRLLLVGDHETGDPVPEPLRRRLSEDPGVVVTGWVPDSAPYYALMDVLAFPSYREGFPNVPLEAAAAAVPTVGFAVTGTVDAVVDGVSGRLVPACDAAALGGALLAYLEDDDLRRRHGSAARERVVAEFAGERVWNALAGFYRQVLPTPRRPFYPRVVKRSLDLWGATVALLATWPLMLVVALLVRWRLGSPVLFRQTRPGLGATPFTLLKFRTMRDARDDRGRDLADAERLTPLGRFLRATSLDELPELVNVLRGEMSLVGPRPLLMEYLDLYTPEQARRHEVVPGITGWAQIHGRNALTWEEKFRLDVWYVDHRSLQVDLSILARTAFQVLRRHGIEAQGHATMPRFEGSAER